jgi:hypothetical protein
LELAMVDDLIIVVNEMTIVLIAHFTDEFTTYYVDFLIDGEFVEGRVLVSCNL